MRADTSLAFYERENNLLASAAPYAVALVGVLVLSFPPT